MTFYQKIVNLLQRIGLFVANDINSITAIYEDKWFFPLYYQRVYICRQLKVSQFRNVFLVSSILPKNELKQFGLRYHSSKVEFFRLFFGRIEDTKKTFRN